jgi:hypothetical protein
MSALTIILICFGIAACLLGMLNDVIALGYNFLKKGRKH